MSSRPARASVLPVSTRLRGLRCLLTVFFLLAGTWLTQADTGPAGEEEKVKSLKLMASSAFQKISTLCTSADTPRVQRVWVAAAASLATSTVLTGSARSRGPFFFAHLAFPCKGCFIASL